MPQFANVELYDGVAAYLLIKTDGKESANLIARRLAEPQDEHRFRWVVQTPDGPVVHGVRWAAVTRPYPESSDDSIDVIAGVRVATDTELEDLRELIHDALSISAASDNPSKHKVDHFQGRGVNHKP